MKTAIRSAIVVLCGAVMGFAQSNVPTVTGVENQGNFKAGESVAPGAFVAIFGTNFATGLTLADTIPLSLQLANVSVTFNNVPAAMVAVANTQINAQVPWNVLSNGTTGTAQVVVTANGVSSQQPASVQIVPSSPSLLALTNLPDNTGVIRPVAYNNSDSSLAYPANSYPAGTFAVTPRPAKVNDPTTLVLLATGLGGTTPPPPPTGAPPAQLSTTVVTPIVMVGGVQASVKFSGLSPQFPSLYQLNIVLDPSTPTGDAIPIVIIDPASRLQSRTDLVIAVTN